jgi:hypothetical protein
MPAKGPLYRAQRLSLVLLTGCLSLAASPAANPPARINYNRDVSPILSENCYACHGPDHGKRKAGLRLDQRESALATLKSGNHAVVPGDLANSELVRRISTTNQDDRMPPVESGKSLTPEQIETLREWVKEGATWSGHWAYVKPERPPVPEVKNKAWPRNEIDNFVLTRLEKEGLKPSPEADRAKLIRRVSLDLTGLPPTVAEVEDYLYDNSPGAYDKLVDRLLNSPHYGERMGQDWLDLARYADSQGYHHDSHRDIWPWRDWVINAFNHNMPFDQFTIEQLAGDLLPNPTRDQRIATGFQRNEMTTSEGGAMPEEYAVKYVVGRVDTAARVWLGTSLACAECHDHKYDPITQKEYYQFFAYFNTIAENGLDQDINPVPRLTLDTPEQRAKVEQFTKEIAALEKAHETLLNAPNPEQAHAQADWEKKLRENAVTSWTVLEPVALSSSGGATLSKLLDDSVRASGPNPDKDIYEVTLRTSLANITGLRLEALPYENAGEGNQLGRGEKGEFLLSRLDVEARAVSTGEATATLDRPQLGHWYALGPFKASSPSEAFEKNFGPESGVDLAKVDSDGKVKWTEHSEWQDGEPHKLEGENSASYLYRTVTVREPRWARMFLGSDDGLQVWWNGRRILAKDVARALAPDQDELVVRIAPGENKLLLKVNNRQGSSGFYFRLLPDPVLEHRVEFAAAAADYNQSEHNIRGALDEDEASGWGTGGESPEAAGPHNAYFRGYDPIGFPGGTELKVRLRFESDKPKRALARFRIAVTSSTGLTEFMNLPDPIRASLIKGDEQQTASQKQALQRYYRQTFVPEVQELSKLLETQRKAKQEYVAQIPVTMVMQEMEKPRDTFLLVRGNFAQHGEKVAPGVPKAIFPMPPDYPKNRLGLAKWLVNPDNPLVSRVTVNHFWQHYFGNGLVKTAEDFGSQGDWPSHPALLDWLATEFIRTHWDVRAMQRLIVTSATYRQSSVVTPEELQRDPDNRLLSHYPHLRLEAEEIRDTALAVSGLLNPQIGGPSVYPYQPPGLWEAVAFENTRKYEQSQGAENYRRGIYTYWRRSIPYPSLITFDAPTRETCTVKRPRTNTPLQALTLMNDPVYVEASRAFGQRIMREGGSTLDSRLDYAFWTCLGRPPRTAEKSLLERAYQEHLEAFEHDRVGAAKLIHVGASTPPVDLDICELATWTLISTTLLNLDETITKG